MTTKKKASAKREKKSKIGIFGGTFDPIHYGHLNSIETVLSAMKLDEIWVVPARQNPLKEILSTSAPEDRLETARLALDTLNSEKFKIKDDEIRRKGASYTIDTLTKFTKLNKLAKFYLIIGADQLETFDKWHDYKKIIKIAKLVITSRPGIDLVKNKFKLKTGKDIFYVQLSDMDVSSTEIRRKIRRGENVSHMTPGIVVDYLIKNKVYDKNEVLVKDYAELAHFCSSVISDKGGLAVQGYDVRNLVQPTEFTLVTSGTSTRHTKALCEHVVNEVKKKYGIRPQGIEGMREGRWVVIDYGSLMIHLFYDFVRREYHVEDLWAQAIRLNL
ncbi:MAG: hypothetical protein A2Z20_01850 [Bdellovibrionales bacterium RBG_16_40_8]|nr:MAG: hypothetical protein A2Z20_01850 [Bdellovibrionales bacterium RBG_16_40_8]